MYAFDSSTIDLCLSVFWWAEFKKHKGGIKLHTLYDVKTSVPSFMLITPAKTHDVNAMDWLHYESGSVYIFDRGYVDFSRLYRIDQSEAWFVIRSKDNMQFRRMHSNKVDKFTGVRSDQIGKLVTPKSLKEYPDKIRKVTFYDEEHKRELVFITNNFELEATEIALLYKRRWMVELFFYAKLKLMGSTFKVLCLISNLLKMRRLQALKIRIGNGLETTQLHRFALIFIF